MTTTPNPEPTLQDLATKLDNLTAKIDKISSDNDKFKADNDKFKAELDKFDDRFSNYQKATQWVVQLSTSRFCSPHPKSLSQTKRGTSIRLPFSRFGRRGWGMRATLSANLQS